MKVSCLLRDTKKKAEKCYIYFTESNSENED
jgi:hypothetical protein